MAYKKCPRCELNWIKEEEEYCDVCKTELKLKGGIQLIEDDDDELLLEEERLCPECKVNYLQGNEKMCAACRAELGAKISLEKDVIVPDIAPEDDDSWRDFVDEDDAPVAEEDEATEISLTELEEEESFDDEEEIVDDFEPADLNLDDFDDDEDEEEEDESDEEEEY